MIIVHASHSDLPRLLTDSFTLESNLQTAIDRAAEHEGILCLCANYPAQKHNETITQSMLETAKKKQLKLFIEYPLSVCGLTLAEPQKTVFERTVINKLPNDELSNGTILLHHSCFITQCSEKISNPWVCSARLAGYRQAIFGIPEDAAPLLFLHPQYDNVLIGLSNFSNLITGRYAPQNDWRKLWNSIIRFVGGKGELQSWEMAVKPSYSEQSALPATAEIEAFNKSVRWFRDNIITLAHSDMLIIEGIDSTIDHNGHQSFRTKTRGDCTGEVALLFGCDYDHTLNPESKITFNRIIEHLFKSELSCVDPQNPCYGMVNFFESVMGYYGDDNCRSMLGIIGASQLLGVDTFDQQILRCLLSVLRTTGANGFRLERIDWPLNFKENQNWNTFQKENVENYRPHCEAYMWAAFLMAYKMSGHQEFLTMAKRGIYDLMSVYPDKIVWTNGFSQEIARMVLPLAWLIRIEDTPVHRELLERIFQDLNKLTVSCGTIRESLGKPETGLYPSPKCNADYGTTEASLIQQNGDPGCDLLYTVNYAFVGLHEAAYATKDKRFVEAADKMADFLVRIQAQSTEQANLNGAWLRGFDFELWDYFGSSADVGWGAWSVESGWTNSWISSVLYLRNQNKSIYDLCEKDRYVKILPQLLEEMSQIHPLPPYLDK